MQEANNQFLSKSEIVPQHTEGIHQSIDEILGDFPGIKIVEAKEEVKLEFELQDESERPSASTALEKQSIEHTLAKSEYIPKTQTDTILFSKEYNDQEFWDIADK